MKAARALALGFTLATAAAAGASLFVPALAVAADQQKVSARVGKPLAAAQEAMKKKQWGEAIAKIQEAQAMDKKTPYEEHQIDEFLGCIYLQQKKYADAAGVYERTLDSSMLSAQQVDERVKMLAQLNLQLQRYPKAIEFIKRYLKNHPGDVELQTSLAQTYYLQKDYKAAIPAMQAVINDSIKNGRKPDENSLQLVLRSNYGIDKEGPGVKDALEQLVHYYPKPEYWKGLLSTLLRGKHPDKQTLAIYRLMLDTDTLDQPNDYVEMAQLSIQAGLPGEAQKIVEKGFANKVLGGSDKDRHERLLTMAKNQATADKAALPKLEKEASASPAGQADVALGLDYLSYDQYDQAIAAIQRGLKKGNVTDVDDTEINLGIAYLHKGDRDQARAAFKTVKSASPWAPLARLWILRAGGTV